VPNDEQFKQPYNPLWKPRWLRLQEYHQALDDPLDKVTVEEHIKYARLVLRKIPGTNHANEDFD